MVWFDGALEVSPSAVFRLCQHAVEEVDIPLRQIHLHLFIASHYRQPDPCCGEQASTSLTPCTGLLRDLNIQIKYVEDSIQK